MTSHGCDLLDNAGAIVLMAKTAAFHGRISAGIDCKLKMVIRVFTEWGVAGAPRGGAAVRRPLGVVATATSNRTINSKLIR